MQVVGFEFSQIRKLIPILQKKITISITYHAQLVHYIISSYYLPKNLLIWSLTVLSQVLCSTLNIELVLSRHGCDGLVGVSHNCTIPLNMQTSLILWALLHLSVSSVRHTLNPSHVNRPMVQQGVRDCHERETGASSETHALVFT